MAGSGSLHIVAFPWLAFGHMIPFLELSKALASRGHKVSYLCTPRNLHRLPKIPPSLSPLIDFVALPLPPVTVDIDHAHTSPDQNPEATSDLPPDQVQHLKKAFDGLEGAVGNFLSEASPKPDWVIQDFASYWLAEAAWARHSIPCAFFSVFPVPSMVFMGTQAVDARTSPEDFTTPPSWVTFPSTVAYKLHEVKGSMGPFNDANALSVSDIYRGETTIATCKAVVVRSVDEFDGHFTQILRDLYGKTAVISTGLLPPFSIPGRDDLGPGGIRILEWLDKHGHGSVVYIAFGSEAPLTPEFVRELALGLEMSQRPFLWALKSPAPQGEEETRLLPEGFEARTSGRGLVVTSWVPQTSVLAHASVGAFLTHSGWSSVIEAVRFGLPLISLPLSNVQGLQSRMVVEKKIAIEIERDEEDGSFTRDAVAEAVGRVMTGAEEEGARLKAEARRWSLVFGDTALQDQYVDGLARYLADHARDSIELQ